MLISPFLVGVIAGGPHWIHLSLAAFWILGYFAFFATSLWLKSGRRQQWLPPVRIYLLAASTTGAFVVFQDPGLVTWVPAFLLPLGVGLWAAAQRRERDLLVGITTIMGASTMALLTYQIGAGELDTRAWQLALVQFLYFTGTVFFVKSAIRERNNPTFLRLSIGYHLAATFLTCWLSGWLGALFLSLTLRAALLPPLKPNPRTLGIMEIVATLLVALISLVVIN